MSNPEPQPSGGKVFNRKNAIAFGIALAAGVILYAVSHKPQAPAASTAAAAAGPPAGYVPVNGPSYTNVTTNINETAPIPTTTSSPPVAPPTPADPPKPGTKEPIVVPPQPQQKIPQPSPAPAHDPTTHSGPPPAPASYTSYTVRSGDTLSAIAGRYGTNWPAIYALNKSQIDSTAMAHGFHSNLYDWIFPGQTLHIPQGTGSALPHGSPLLR